MLIDRSKNRACFQRWEYGLLTNRIISAGVSKGPLVCAFHLRVCDGDKKKYDDDDDDDGDDRSGDRAGC